MDLNSKVSQLNRVGNTVSKQLKALGIETVRDLLFYYPFRYEDYSQISPISDLQTGSQVTVFGKIELLQNRKNFRTRRFVTDAVIADDTGRLRVVWFGQPYLTKNLRIGESIYLSGKVGRDRVGINMSSPSYEKPNSSGQNTHTARIVPIYPLTSGITQKQLRFLVSQVIGMSGEVEDWLDEEILDRADVMPLSEAIKIIHFPEDKFELEHARRRLKFDELFVLQLRAEMVRRSLKRQIAPQIKFKKEETVNFVSHLPFILTVDQKKAAWEILQDMEKTEPMNRLLQGDVGSGKTVVAAICANNAILNKHQTILMAPTEVLAGQHYESFCGLFKNTNVKISLYTRSCAELNFRSDIESYGAINGRKKFIAKKIKKGEINIIVGTHALLSEKVDFADLGLVVVDEQQRFGVEQRKHIREKSGEKNTMPHFLSMTATPIPRSLALTVYGDLDISIIRGLPPGRKEIKTRLVADYNRIKAYDFIRAQIKQGRQAFVVCPLIENSDNESGGMWSDVLEKKSVMSEYEKLQKNIFPDLKVEYLHGKMKPQEKDEIMQKFSKGETDILVSTSVIEVGVNVPNAAVIIIEGAERFGLAQLHQFRGRVGRSIYQSYCFLFTDSSTQKAIDRLSFFEKTNDGFKLAEFDLSQRGPGEVYGTQQSGVLSFKFADTRDTDLIKLSRQLAKEADFDQKPALKERVRQWEGNVHLE